MKTLSLITLAAALLSGKAQALTVCAGETFSGTIVTVSVVTAGATGKLQSASVTIVPAAETARSYSINKEEISQFFESTSDDSRRALVGLVAYVGAENPISIRYSGQNYQDNLVTVLRMPAPIRPRESGNEMRVWKGPGFPSDQQHQFRDVVCQVTLEP